MIQKWKLGFILAIIIGISPIARAEITAKDEMLPYLQTGEIPVSVFQEIDQRENSIDTAVDTVLEYLLSIPFEQRQYIFPALFDDPRLPKKIRKHPEIAIWEGKVPTRLAPEAMEYADKYLNDLNPRLYIYLSPEGYAKGRDKDVALMKKNEMISFAPKSIPKIVGSFDSYPDLKEVMQQSEELKQNPNMAILSEADIQNIGTGLNIFADYLKDEIASDVNLRAQYHRLSNLYTDQYKERLHPFMAKWERLKLMGQADQLEEKLKAVGWKSGEHFAKVADAMASGYRAARVSLIVSLQAWRFRGINPQNESEKIIQTGSKLYESLPADVRLVAKNLDVVRQAFIKNGFQPILNAEMIDEVRK